MGVLGGPSGSIISLLKYFSVLDFRTNCKGEKKGNSGKKGRVGSLGCRLECGTGCWGVCDDDSFVVVVVVEGVGLPSQCRLG